MEVTMNEITVSIRELKSRLSHYLRLAKAGQIVEITYRGKPIGRIVTVASSLEERIEATRRSGLLSWNGQKLEPLKPVAKLRTKKTVAELVVEDRRCSPKEKSHEHDLPSASSVLADYRDFVPSFFPLTADERARAVYAAGAGKREQFPRS
jgi:prevent-host-death family protein